MSRKFKVGIFATPVAVLDREAETLGPDIELFHLEGSVEEDLDPAVLAELDGLMVWRASLGARTAAAMKKGRILAAFSVGYDAIDVKAFEQAGMVVTNNPDYGTEEVADTAMAMILSLQRRLSRYDYSIRDEYTNWMVTLPPVRRSNALTVGVVGVGRIGTAVINRLRPFGYTILGYDPYQPSGHEKAIGYRRTRTLDELLEQSDILTLHCPLSDETRGIVDAKALARLKPDAIFVNTARGGLLADLDCLEAALRSGHLVGAGLDVLPDEPQKPHPLLDAWRRREDWLEGRLMVNPHVAFYANEAFLEQRCKPCDTVRMYLVDGWLRNRVTL